MLTKEAPAPRRAPRTVNLEADFVVVGGGLAGVCAAVTAARAGATVVLIQDRPVLGGNASSEVRLWVLGATAHCGNNNRWAREPGVINEIVVENMYRNPEGNAVLFDPVVLDLVRAEPHITLLLNTAAYDCEKAAGDPDRITGVHAFCSQNQTQYNVRGRLFCDASGDGVLAFRAGAAFRMGAETKAEFGEPFAPDEKYGSLLGHSIYFYSKDAGKPVKFVPPRFALAPEDIEKKIPRYRNFRLREDGCRLWWIEYGGRLDTVHDTEEIKWELWKVAYGVWNYFKNSGKFPQAANLTLEWVGLIPGKRESRRFEGDYMVVQQDVIEGRRHDDDIAFGGWALDLHPADGVYSPFPGCTHWQAKGYYPIPYRSLYSRNLKNLFLAGRIMSVSHAAFGSTRVIGTLSFCAQAVGMAAALAAKENLLPRDFSTGERLARLQLELLRAGQHIPGKRLEDPLDLARQAKLTASSSLQLRELSNDGGMRKLTQAQAQMLPAAAGPVPAVSFELQATADTTAVIELRQCSRIDHHSPDTILKRQEVKVIAGAPQWVTVDFAHTNDQPRYLWAVVLQNEALSIRTSKRLVTGLFGVQHRGTQSPPKDIGVESFGFWTPPRRPDAQNLAIRLSSAITTFGPENLTNGLFRPTRGPNAWVADFADAKPSVTLTWEKAVTLSRLVLDFDPDWDHPMESVLYGHPDRAMPHCAKHVRITDKQGKTVAEIPDNHHARWEVRLPAAVSTDALTIEVLAMNGPCPAAIFGVRCYA